ncbi:MaoC family dehydratase [Knoellia koreensis]|uniref:MaoC family dehydratase n=1 Tax=Knoellia koreensis TaxID=2730921 RepID=A0A849HLD6_9MICO|nr:MaoC family dehydratase [Knoellia sp. DB2414S]NNM47483.1 MaoC family dehydratase [Knoellia sp. DB2414S]
MAVRSFDEVSVGETFGPTAVPVGRETLVAYANASGDQNPIHQDEDFAKTVGLPDIIAHGMWTMGAAGSVLEQWLGDGGRIVEFGTRFTSMVVVPREGTEIVVTGTVKSLDEDTRRATVELGVTAGDTKVLGRCQAVVALA